MPVARGSLARTALEHGLNANLLRKWVVKQTGTRLARRRGMLASVSPVALLPVMTQGSGTSAPQPPRTLPGAAAQWRHDPSPWPCPGRGALDGGGLPGTTHMIALPAARQLWLAAGVTDMRRGIYGLAALVETILAK